MTSPPREVTVDCPKCGLRYQDWCRASINLDLESFDDEYLDRASSAVCPGCTHKVYFGTLVVRNGVFTSAVGGAPIHFKRPG
jgi:hypothetical protein